MYEYPLTPSLAVSFQRYPYPPTGVVTELPSSWGALPLLLRAPQQLLLPCPAGEAFWIGLVPSPADAGCLLHVLVSTPSGELLDAMTGTHVNRSDPTPVEGYQTPPRPGLAGISRGDGSWWALAHDADGPSAPQCRGVELHAQPTTQTEPLRRIGEHGKQHLGRGTDASPPSAAPRSEPAEPSPPIPQVGQIPKVRVEVIDAPQFEALASTSVPPLDERNRYRGWRLP
jgi:hypothetical protein